MEERFLTTDDVSEILCITRQAIHEWIKHDQLKYYRVGRGIRIRPEDLIQYLKNLRNPPETIKMYQKIINNFLKVKYSEDIPDYKKGEKYLKENVKFLIADLKNSDSDVINIMYKFDLLDSLNALKLCISAVDFLRYVAQILGTSEEKAHKEILKYIPPSEKMKEIKLAMEHVSDEEKLITLKAQYNNEVDKYNPVPRISKTATVYRRE